MSTSPDFQRLFESVPALIMVLAPDSPRFTILAASDAYLRATKLQREAMVGRPVFEVFPENPDQPSGAEANSRASFERVLQRRLPDIQALQQHDIRRPESEGGGFETRFWSPLNTPVLDENGQVRYIIHRVEDVTELVQAKQQAEKEGGTLEKRAREIALIRREANETREREARYAAIFEKSPFSLALIRISDKAIVDVNEAFLKLFECTRGSVTGKTLTDAGIIDIKVQARLEAELRQRGTVRNAEIDARTMAGIPCTLLLNLDWVSIGDEPLLFGTIEDITERKEFERALQISEERYRVLFNSIDEGFCIVELLLDEADRPIDYRFVATNPAFEKHTGISDAVGRRMREIAPNLEEHWFEIYGKVAITGESVRFQNHARALGRYFDVYAFRIGEPVERLVAILFSDITERKLDEEQLKLAATVFNSSSEAIVITDADTRIVAVNPAFETITGYKPDEVLGKNPNILKSDHHDRAFYQAFWQELNATGSWKGEFWNRSKSGDIFVVLTAINTTFNPDGSVQSRVAVITDITEKKKSDELVWQQANFDALTGLPNRRLFQDHLQHDIKKARRSRLPLALMFMDLDGFKDVNDALGHEAGDILLKETGKRLLKCVRETDTVARMGGDEFTVILTELTNLRHVSTVAEQILQKLSEPFLIGNEIAHISGSVGITLYPQDASNMEELLINADQAMYAAKAAGKNRYSFFTEAMQHAAQERTWLVNELRSAIDSRQFSLVYQPIVELASGCINKAEALLRWQHPERGLIEPSVFIPVAEETGMIREIGDWVFFEAANQAAIWRKAFHPDFQVSINKSPVQFKTRSGDVSSLLEHLKSLGLPGQSVAVEITEGVLMDESQTVTDQLFAFRDAGIEVSLDDFGTGYSTLSYLKRFDIDRLKIDQIFIRNLETDPDDLALCEAMIVMGHKLGIKIMAEGVETDRQREILTNAGCDFMQGYLLSGPVSAEELGVLLKKGSLYCPGPSLH